MIHPWSKYCVFLQLSLLKIAFVLVTYSTSGYFCFTSLNAFFFLLVVSFAYNATLHAANLTVLIVCHLFTWHRFHRFLCDGCHLKVVFRQWSNIHTIVVFQILQKPCLCQFFYPNKNRGGILFFIILFHLHVFLENLMVFVVCFVGVFYVVLKLFHPVVCYFVFWGS